MIGYFDRSRWDPNPSVTAPTAAQRAQRAQRAIEDARFKKAEANRRIRGLTEEEEAEFRDSPEGRIAIRNRDVWGVFGQGGKDEDPFNPGRPNPASATTAPPPAKINFDNPGQVDSQENKNFERRMEASNMAEQRQQRLKTEEQKATSAWNNRG